MPQITVKTKHIELLKALGVYDQWLFNMKEQSILLTDDDKQHMQETPRFLIIYAFNWDITTEGSAFWEDVYEKLKYSA